MIPKLFYEPVERLLLRHSRSSFKNRDAILYITYFFVLACCFLSPCVYYVRFWVWQRRHLRRLRDMEQAAMLAAMAQSAAGAGSGGGGSGGLSAPFQHHHHHHPRESAAVRDERCARILQLMEPVRMVRTTSNNTLLY
jgi:hypothetical protein